MATALSNVACAPVPMATLLVLVAPDLAPSATPKSAACACTPTATAACLETVLAYTPDCMVSPVRA